MAIYIHKNDMHLEYQPGDFILYHTDWNDWWTYENLYTLKYVRTDTTLKLIGQVKVGQLDDSDSRVPDLPNSFSQLDPNRFISLGQDPTYYDSLNRLGLHVKESFLTALNDIAFNTSLLHQHRQQDVVKRSLMRDIPFSTVENQFNRVARGGAIDGALQDAELRDRLSNHLKVFDLTERYAKKAAEEISANKLTYQAVLDAGGLEGLRSYLQLLYASAYSAEKNSWRTALYKALMDVEQIVIDGKIAI